jgi:glycosyltransferase involved in cell wall biosynthesis
MSLRWLVIHLDIIAIRSLPHLSQHVQARAAVEFYLTYANHIITISEFSRDDVMSYFNLSGPNRMSVVTLGIPESLASQKVVEGPPLLSGSVFIVGNSLPHKQVDKALTVLLDAGLTVTSLGEGQPLAPAHRVVSPRDTDDASLARILNETSVVVFPSCYEGFGLPVIEAAHVKKPIVVADTEINREVTKLLGREDHTVFFTALKNIPEAVSKAQKLVNSGNSKVPLLSEFSERVLKEGKSLLSKPLDFPFVEQRWQMLTFMYAAMTEQEEHTLHKLSQRRFSKRISHKFSGFFR